MPLLWTKIPNVGVALVLICVVTLGPMAEMHCPVVGFVSQRETFSGNIALPMSADAVMPALAPTFTVATAKAPVPVAPGMFTMPSWVGVAAQATMSETGVAETESSSVFSPDVDRRRIAVCTIKAKLQIRGGQGLGRDEGNDKTLKTTARNVDRCVGSAGDLIGVWVGRLVVKASCQTA